MRRRVCDMKSALDHKKSAPIVNAGLLDVEILRASGLGDPTLILRHLLPAHLACALLQGNDDRTLL